MSHFINNLKFIGYTIFPKKNSKKLKDFNKTKLAEYLEMDLAALSRWVSGNNPISKINLNRIAKRTSEYFKIDIPPDVILKGNLKKYIDKHKTTTIKYIISEPERSIIADRSSLIEQINFLLNKHKEIQPIIFELLNKYDKK